MGRSRGPPNACGHGVCAWVVVCVPRAGVCARVRDVSAAGRALALLLPKSLSETRVSVMAQLVSKNGVNQMFTVCFGAARAPWVVRSEGLGRP